MPKFGLFRKTKKSEDQEAQEPEERQAAELSSPATSITSESANMPATQKGTSAEDRTFLRAMPLRDLSDLEIVKDEVKKGNIIILRVTPLANKSLEEVKNAVDQLTVFTESIHGDIARLGEERIVVCPENIRIWRKNDPAKALSTEPVPTAA